MCLAVPMKIVSREGDSVVAEVDGVQKEASIMLLGEEVAVGRIKADEGDLPPAKTEEPEKKVAAKKAAA